METLSSASKKTIVFSLPIIGSRFLGTLSSFLGMLMIAKLGHAQLAAGALVSSIQITLNVICWSILFSIPVVVGQLFGKKQYHEIGDVFRSSCYFSLFISIPLAFVYWQFGPILKFFGEPSNLVDLVRPYFHVLALGVIPSMFGISFSQLMTGVARPRFSLYISCVSMGIMLIFAYGLLFGRFGFPCLGMIGMAYATILMYWVSAIVSLGYLVFNPYFKQFNLFVRQEKEGTNYLKKLFHIGYPISIHFGSELTAFAFATVMIGWLGESSLAAQQIIIQLACLVMMIPSGISQASSVLVGHAIGRKDFMATRIFAKAGFAINAICMLIVACIYWTCPYRLVSFFSVNSATETGRATIHLAVILLAIDAFNQMFDGIRAIAVGVLRGFHETRFPMFMGIIASWVIAIPMSYLVGIVFHQGVIGVRLSFLLAWIIGAINLMRHVYKVTAVGVNEHQGTHNRNIA